MCIFLKYNAVEWLLRSARDFFLFIESEVVLSEVGAMWAETVWAETVLDGAGTVMTGIGTVFNEIKTVSTEVWTTMLSRPLIERLMIDSWKCKPNFGGRLSRNGN